MKLIPFLCLLLAHSISAQAQSPTETEPPTSLGLGDVELEKVVQDWWGGSSFPSNEEQAALANRIEMRRGTALDQFGSVYEYDYLVGIQLALANPAEWTTYPMDTAVFRNTNERGMKKLLHRLDPAICELDGAPNLYRLARLGPASRLDAASCIAILDELKAESPLLEFLGTLILTDGLNFQAFLLPDAYNMMFATIGTDTSLRLEADLAARWPRLQGERARAAANEWYSFLDARNWPEVQDMLVKPSIYRQYKLLSKLDGVDIRQVHGTLPPEFGGIEGKENEGSDISERELFQQIMKPWRDTAHGPIPGSRKTLSVEEGYMTIEDAKAQTGNYIGAYGHPGYVYRFVSSVEMVDGKTMKEELVLFFVASRMRWKVMSWRRL